MMATSTLTSSSATEGWFQPNTFNPYRTYGTDGGHSHALYQDEIERRRREYQEEMAQQAQQASLASQAQIAPLPIQRAIDPNLFVYTEQFEQTGINEEKELEKKDFNIKTAKKSFQPLINNIEKSSKQEIEKKAEELRRKEEELVNLQKDLRRQKKKIEKAKSLSNTELSKQLENDLEIIQKNPEVKKVYFYGDDLVIETKDLFVQDFYMEKYAKFKRKTKKKRPIGNFAIRIHIRDRAVALSVTSLTWNCGDHGLPTLREHQCCFGNIHSDIVNDLTNLRLAEFVQDMVDFLQAPSNQNAYISWKRYFDNREKLHTEPNPAYPSQEFTLARGTEDTDATAYHTISPEALQGGGGVGGFASMVSGITS